MWSDRLRAEPKTNWVDLANIAARVLTGETAPTSPQATIRGGLSMAAVSEAMTNLVNIRFFDGYKSVPDSTDGWATEAGVENFLPAHALGIFEQSRLEQVDRTPAPHGYFGLIAENWALARYAKQLILSETDLLNSPSVDLTMLAADTLGRAAARLPLDLVYGLLLRNPKMSYDGKTFFHSDHGNLATGPTSALGETSLDAAMAAVALQSAPDGETDIPIPCGTQGHFLVVAPALLGKARRLARWMSLSDFGDLAVRVEPRLTLGVVDPSNDTLVSGSATPWLLASPASIAPSIIVGGLGGTPKPQIRQFELGGPGEYAGQWGVGFDIVYDLGCVALDPRGLYFSTGA